MTVEYDPIHRSIPLVKANELRADNAAILARTKVPSERAKQRARQRDLQGVRIYKGAESIVVSSANANDYCHHLGWSLMPTRAWRDAQAH